MLYVIPKDGCDLSYLVTRYTCFNRVAVPGYEIVAGCLDRAIRAGIVRPPTDGRYVVNPAWFARIHDRLTELSASEHIALDFSVELEAADWPEVGKAFVLDEAEYRKAEESTKRYLDELFGRRVT